jgi:hypothetical protein
MFFPKKNPNAKLAGGLPRRDTALPDQTIDYQNRIDELPLVTAPPTSPEFAQQLKAFFRQAVETCGLAARSATEQYRNIVAALGLKFRRPPIFDKGPQTATERKRRSRQRQKDWDWLPFPIIPHAGYLVIEASPEEEIALFDIHRAHIVIGYELQRTMDAHHRDYPRQKSPANQPEQHGTEFETELSRIKILVLKYSDKILYIAPAYETPPTLESTVRGEGLSSLNVGLFLIDAPKGKGKLRTGWGQKKGYNKNTSSFQPALDDISDFYADEFATEDDHEGEDASSSNPEGFGNRARTEDELNEQIKNSEFGVLVEESGRNSEGKSETEIGVLKCRICGEVLDGDDDDDTLLFKHLEERHFDEYQRIGWEMEKQFEEARTKTKKRELRQLEKQKHCLEDHDGMFARQLKAHGPGAYECGSCGAALCKGTHVGQVEEVLTERAAYRDTLSFQERLDANKRKAPSIKCKFCGGVILPADYE